LQRDLVFFINENSAIFLENSDAVTKPRGMKNESPSYSNERTKERFGGDVLDGVPPGVADQFY